MHVKELAAADGLKRLGSGLAAHVLVTYLIKWHLLDQLSALSDQQHQVCYTEAVPCARRFRQLNRSAKSLMWCEGKNVKLMKR